MYAGRIRVGVVAALVDHLPPGGAVGAELGGPAAMSMEWHAIARLSQEMRGIAWVQGGKKGKRPESWPYPEGKRQREAREAREAEAKKRWLENSRRRQQLREQGELRLRDL